MQIRHLSSYRQCEGRWPAAWWIIAALGILLSGLSAPVVAQSADEICQLALEDYRVALQSYQDGFYDPAFAGFEAYILSCPAGEFVGQAHYLLAVMLTEQSQCKKALAHVKEALAQPLTPELRPHVLFLGARCALQLKQQNLAQTYLQETVVAEVPGEIKASAFSWLGELAFERQDYDAAKRYYTWALQESPSGPHAAHAHYSLGFIAQEAGDIAAALRAFEAFLKLAPAHQSAAQVRFTQADLLRQGGQLKAAAAAFKTLSQTLKPGAMREESLFRWAELTYELENYREAQTAYAELIQAFPQSKRLSASLYGLGWSALRQEHCQAAVSSWEQLLKLPADGMTPQQIHEVHYHLGICYIELGDRPRARQYLRQVAMADEDTMEQREAVVKVATLAYQAGDYDEAITFYTQAITTAEAQQVSRFHFLIGESFQAQGETGQAVTHWQQALKGSADLPFYPKALDRLGRVYGAMRDWNQAIPVLRRLWDEFPDFAERQTIAYGLAQAYGQSNQCEAALPFYAFLAGSPQGETALRDLRHSHAACLFTLARYEDLVALLAPQLASEQAAAMGPVMLYSLGQAHMELQQFEAAIAPLKQLQTEFPAHPLSRKMLPRLAYALEQTGRPDEALQAWQAHVAPGAEADEGGRLRLHLHMARLAFQAKRFDHALELLPEAHETAAPSIAAEVQFWRAEIYYAQEQWDLAKQHYLELLKRNGGDRWDVAAWVRLAAVYEHRREWDLALDTYRRLRDTATDAQTIANAERRIAAIEAGLVRSRPATPPPTGHTPPSSEG